MVVFVCLFAPVTYSYVTTMLQPSSLPLSIRSVEWLRSNHGAWLVNTVERYWYSWHTPKPGGPTLTRLPSVGSPAGAPTAAVASWRPAPIRPVIVPALAGEGLWRPTGV